MAMVINTNTASINAQRSLASSQSELQLAMERLSSGKRINSASDDAAGFAIAERMTAQIRGLNMAAKNAQDGLAMLATAENATNDVTDMLQRIRELAVQGANDTNSAKDREYLQDEVDALLTEINRVSTQTRYNNLILLDGQRTGTIQVGTRLLKLLPLILRLSTQIISVSPVELLPRTTQEQRALRMELSPTGRAKMLAR